VNPQITPFYEPESCTWTYLLAAAEGGAAAIIDPVWVYDPVTGVADTVFTDGVLDAAGEAGLDIEWVLETHAHADHLSSGAYIRDRTGAKIGIGRGICSVQENFVKVFNLDGVATDGSQFDRLLGEGDTIRLGSLEIRVMETPGHTSDSVTYVCGDAAFVGDTLFAPGYGTARCDFPGGDAALLYDSIGRIHALPGDTRLHLCHDYPKKGEDPVSVVTVAESLAGNIHAGSGTTREEFVAMRTARDAQLGLPKLIYPSVQVNICAGAAPFVDSNGACYLKIPFNEDIAALLQRAD